MSQLTDFIQRTENESSDIRSPGRTLQVQYPFLYVTSVTNVELRNWKQSEVLHGMSTGDNDVALYLKKDSYRLLGYVTLSMNTFKVLSSLMERTIIFKRDKYTEEPVTDHVVNFLLLGD